MREDGREVLSVFRPGSYGTALMHMYCFVC
jgi:hypothetical protein